MDLVINMKKTKYEKSSSSGPNQKSTIMSGNELKSLIVLIAIVSVIFLVFYGITLLVDKKEPTQENGVVQETIQYDEILVGQILNRDEKEYYVLIKNSDNHYNDLYAMYLKKTISGSENIKYYTVDLSSAFNASYCGESTVVEKGDFYNSKFADTTLIKIKNKKISKVYSTHDDILAILEQMAA